MYSCNKLTSLICIISSITFLSACGGSSEDTKTYTPPKVMSEVKTDLKFLRKILPSSQSTTVDQPVYRFTQIFSKENNQFKQSYKLEFDFNADNNTFYQLEANYDEIINSIPKSIRLSEYKKNNEGTISRNDFLCSEKDNPCSKINILSSINIKTGQARLNFNNLLLSKSSWANGQLNTITLAGYVEGILTEAPTEVQLPTSQNNEFKWSTTSSSQESINLLNNYHQLEFTNHNNIFFSFENGSIVIKNNKVNGVYINFPNSSDYYYATCSTATLLCEGTTYNPVNYQVTFDNTKVQSIFWGNNIDIGYLNGSVGL